MTIDNVINMADKSGDPSKMGHQEWKEYATVHKRDSPHYIHKHEDRLPVVLQRLVDLSDNEARLGRLLKEEIVDKVSIKDKELDKLYLKIDTLAKHKFEHKDSEDWEPDDFDEALEGVVHHVMKKMGYAVGNDSKKSYKAFMNMHINHLGKEGANDLIGKLYSAVQQGEGKLVSQAVIDTMTSYHVNTYFSEVNQKLLAPHLKRFQRVAGDHMKKVLKKETGVDVSLADIVENYTSNMRTFAKGKEGYLSLANKNKLEKVQRGANDGKYQKVA